MRKIITHTVAVLTGMALAFGGAATMTAASAAPAHVRGVDVAKGDARRAMWKGFTVGEVIVCPKGMTVSVDEGTLPGRTWAACM